MCSVGNRHLCHAWLFDKSSKFFLLRPGWKTLRAFFLSSTQQGKVGITGKLELGMTELWETDMIIHQIAKGLSAAPILSATLKALLLLTLAAASAHTAIAQRTQLKPAWNLYSPEKDVEVGRVNALQAEKQLVL